MEFNNGNSSLASTSSSLQTQNEIGCGDVKFGENSEITNRCYSSSENVASSSFGDNYGNIPTILMKKILYYKQQNYFWGRMD
uniref:Uncharacterized protein n=1 Tax=Meloidogyne enterolobii TaxID=390850 RepID=A0A6V7VE44_MELEN|nr:unnamed protein product [Meloidogyne enterolobii]